MSKESIENLEIKNRYTKEAHISCNLSCGSNIENLNLKQGEMVLDLGCGKGKETIEVANLVGKNGKSIGLDLTNDMLDIARENALSQKVNNIEFLQGDIEDLPFTSDTFDGVISNCVINHAKDKTKVYREIYRVLKEYGRFVVSDAVTKFPLPQEIKEDPVAIANCFGGAVTEEEYLNSIKIAGFSEIEIIKRREYLKNGYDFISLTIKATK